MTAEFSFRSASMASNQIIQGLWIGAHLTIMERMSIASFLHHGHEYHLYTYDDVANVPSGTVIKDANEILAGSAIFQYKEYPSYAGFSNFFRYKLLLERGGWWSDSDIICLRPFDFTDEYVFSSEMYCGKEVTNAGVIKAPAGSDAIAYAWNVCQKKNPNKLVWGEIGPGLVSEIVKKYRLDNYRKPYYTFCPIPHWHSLLEPYIAGVHEDAYALHLWNEMWRRNQQDKDATYHPGCIYEILKVRYL